MQICLPSHIYFFFGVENSLYQKYPEVEEELTGS